MPTTPSVKRRNKLHQLSNTPSPQHHNKPKRLKWSFTLRSRNNGSVMIQLSTLKPSTAITPPPLGNNNNSRHQNKSPPFPLLSSKKVFPTSSRSPLQSISSANLHGIDNIIDHNGGDEKDLFQTLTSTHHSTPTITRLRVPRSLTKGQFSSISSLFNVPIITFSQNSPWVNQIKFHIDFSRLLPLTQSRRFFHQPKNNHHNPHQTHQKTTRSSALIQPSNSIDAAPPPPRRGWRSGVVQPPSKPLPPTESDPFKNVRDDKPLNSSTLLSPLGNSSLSSPPHHHQQNQQQQSQNIPETIGADPTTISTSKPKLTTPLQQPIISLNTINTLNSNTTTRNHQQEYNYRGELLNPSAVAFGHLSQRFGSMAFAPKSKTIHDIYRNPNDPTLPRGEIAPHIVEYIRHSVTTQQQYEEFSQTILDDLKAHIQEPHSLDSVSTIALTTFERALHGSSTSALSGKGITKKSQETLIDQEDYFYQPFSNKKTGPEKPKGSNNNNHNNTNNNLNNHNTNIFINTLTEHSSQTLKNFHLHLTPLPRQSLPSNFQTPKQSTQLANPHVFKDRNIIPTALMSHLGQSVLYNRTAFNIEFPFEQNIAPTPLIKSSELDNMESITVDFDQLSHKAHKNRQSKSQAPTAKDNSTLLTSNPRALKEYNEFQHIRSTYYSRYIYPLTRLIRLLTIPRAFHGFSQTTIHHDIYDTILDYLQHIPSSVLEPTLLTWIIHNMRSDNIFPSNSQVSVLIELFGKTGQHFALFSFLDTILHNRTKAVKATRLSLFPAQLTQEQYNTRLKRIAYGLPPDPFQQQVNLYQDNQEGNNNIINNNTNITPLNSSSSSRSSRSLLSLIRRDTDDNNKIPHSTFVRLLPSEENEILMQSELDKFVTGSQPNRLFSHAEMAKYNEDEAALCQDFSNLIVNHRTAVSHQSLKDPRGIAAVTEAFEKSRNQIIEKYHQLNQRLVARLSTTTTTSTSNSPHDDGNHQYSTITFSHLNLKRSFSLISPQFHRLLTQDAFAPSFENFESLTKAMINAQSPNLLPYILHYYQQYPKIFPNQQQSSLQVSIITSLLQVGDCCNAVPYLQSLITNRYPISTEQANLIFTTFCENAPKLFTNLGLPLAHSPVSKQSTPQQSNQQPPTTSASSSSSNKTVNDERPDNDLTSSSPSSPSSPLPPNSNIAMSWNGKSNTLTRSNPHHTFSKFVDGFHFLVDQDLIQCYMRLQTTASFQSLRGITDGANPTTTNPLLLQWQILYPEINLTETKNLRRQAKLLLRAKLGGNSTDHVIDLLAAQGRGEQLGFRRHMRAAMAQHRRLALKNAAQKEQMENATKLEKLQTPLLTKLPLKLKKPLTRDATMNTRNLRPNMRYNNDKNKRNHKPWRSSKLPPLVPFKDDEFGDNNAETPSALTEYSSPMKLFSRLRVPLSALRAGIHNTQNTNIFSLSKYRSVRRAIRHKNLRKELLESDLLSNQAQSAEISMFNVIRHEFNPRRRNQRLVAQPSHLQGVKSRHTLVINDEVNPFDWNTPALSNRTTDTLRTPTTTINKHIQSFVTVDTNDSQNYVTVTPAQATTLIHIVSFLQHAIGLLRQQNIQLDPKVITSLFKFFLDAGLHGEASHLLSIMFQQQFDSAFLPSSENNQKELLTYHQSLLDKDPQYANSPSHLPMVPMVPNHMRSNPLQHLMTSLLDELTASTQLYESDIIQSLSHAQSISMVIKDVDLLIYKNSLKYHAGESDFYQLTPEQQQHREAEREEENDGYHSRSSSLMEDEFQLTDHSTLLKTLEQEQAQLDEQQQQQQQEGKPSSDREGTRRRAPRLPPLELLENLSRPIQNTALEAHIRRELLRIDVDLSEEIDRILSQELTSVLSSTGAEAESQHLPKKRLAEADSSFTEPLHLDRKTLLNPKLLQQLHPMLYKQRELAINTALQKGFQAKLLLTISNTKPTMLLQFPLKSTPSVTPIDSTHIKSEMNNNNNNNNNNNHNTTPNSRKKLDFVTRESLDDLARIRDRYLLHLISLRPQHPETLTTSMIIHKQHLNLVRTLSPESLLSKSLRQTHQNSPTPAQLYEQGHDPSLLEPTRPVRPNHPYDSLQGYINLEDNNTSRNLAMMDSLNMDVVPLLYLNNAKDALDYAQRHYRPRPVSLFDWSGVSFPPLGPYHITAVFKQHRYQQFESFKMFETILKYQRFHTLHRSVHQNLLTSSPNNPEPSKNSANNEANHDASDKTSLPTFSPSAAFKILKPAYTNPNHLNKIRSALGPQIVTCDNVLVDHMKHYANLHHLDYDTVGLCYIDVSDLESQFNSKSKSIIARRTVVERNQMRNNIFVRHDDNDEIFPDNGSNSDDDKEGDDDFVEAKENLHDDHQVFTSNGTRGGSKTYGQNSPYILPSITLHSSHDVTDKTSKRLALIFRPHDSFLSSFLPVLCFNPFYTSLIKSIFTVDSNTGYLIHATRSLAHALGIDLNPDQNLIQLPGPDITDLCQTSGPEQLLCPESFPKKYTSSVIQHSIKKSLKESPLLQHLLNQPKSAENMLGVISSLGLMLTQSNQTIRGSTYPNTIMFHDNVYNHWSYQQTKSSHQQQRFQYQQYLAQFYANLENEKSRKILATQVDLEAGIEVASVNNHGNLQSHNDLNELFDDDDFDGSGDDEVRLHQGKSSITPHHQLQQHRSVANLEVKEKDKKEAIEGGDEAELNSEPVPFHQYQPDTRVTSYFARLLTSFSMIDGDSYNERVVQTTTFKPTPISEILSRSQTHQASFFSSQPSQLVPIHPMYFDKTLSLLSGLSSPLSDLRVELLNNLPDQIAPQPFTSHLPGSKRWPHHSHSQNGNNSMPNKTLGSISPKFPGLSSLLGYDEVGVTASLQFLGKLPPALSKSLSSHRYLNPLDFLTGNSPLYKNHRISPISTSPHHPNINIAGSTNEPNNLDDPYYYQTNNDFGRWNMTQSFLESLVNDLSSTTALTSYRRFTAGIFRYHGGDFSKKSILTRARAGIDVADQHDPFHLLKQRIDDVPDNGVPHNDTSDDFEFVDPVENGLLDGEDRTNHNHLVDMNRLTQDNDQILQPLSHYSGLIDEFYHRVQFTHYQYLTNPVNLSFLHNNLSTQQEYEELLLTHMSSLTTSMLVSNFTTLTQELFNLMHQRQDNIPVQSIIELTNLCSIQPRGITHAQDAHIYDMSNFILLPQQSNEIDPHPLHLSHPSSSTNLSTTNTESSSIITPVDNTPSTTLITPPSPPQQDSPIMISCLPIRSIVLQQLLSTLYPSSSLRVIPNGSRSSPHLHHGDVTRSPIISPAMCDLIINVLSGNPSPEALAVHVPRLAYNIRRQSSTIHSSYVLSNGVVANHINATTIPSISSTLPIVSQRLRQMPLNAMMREFNDVLNISDLSFLNANNPQRNITISATKTTTDLSQFPPDKIGKNALTNPAGHDNNKSLLHKNPHTLFASRQRPRRGVVELIGLYSMAQSIGYDNLLPDEICTELLSHIVDPTTLTDRPKAKDVKHFELLHSVPRLNSSHLQRRIVAEIAATHATRLSHVFSQNLNQTLQLPSSRLQAIDTIVRITQFYRFELSKHLANNNNNNDSDNNDNGAATLNATQHRQQKPTSLILSSTPSPQIQLHPRDFDTAALSSPANTGIFALHSQYVLSLARMGCASASIYLSSDIFFRNTLPTATKHEKCDLLASLINVFESQGDFNSTITIFRSFVHSTPSGSYAQMDDLTTQNRLGYSKFNSLSHAYSLPESAIVSLLRATTHADRPVVLDTVLDILLYARRCNPTLPRSIIHETFNVLQHHAFTQEGFDLFMTMADPAYMNQLIHRELTRDVEVPQSLMGTVQPTAFSLRQPKGDNDQGIDAHFSPDMGSRNRYAETKLDTNITFTTNAINANTAGDLNQVLYQGQTLARLESGAQLDPSFELLSDVIESTVNLIPTPSPSISTPRRIDNGHELDVKLITRSQQPLKRHDDVINLDSEMDPQMIHLAQKSPTDSIYDIDLVVPVPEDPIKSQSIISARAVETISRNLGDKDYDREYFSGLSPIPSLDHGVDLMDAPSPFSHHSTLNETNIHALSNRQSIRIDRSADHDIDEEKNDLVDSDFEIDHLPTTINSPRSQVGKNFFTAVSNKTLRNVYALSPKFPILTNVQLPTKYHDPLHHDATELRNNTNAYVPSAFIYSFHHLLNPSNDSNENVKTRAQSRTLKREGLSLQDDHKWSEPITLLPSVNLQTYRSMIEILSTSTSQVDHIAYQFFRSIAPPTTYNQYVSQLTQLQQMEGELEDKRSDLIKMVLPTKLKTNYFRLAQTQIQNPMAAVDPKLAVTSRDPTKILEHRLITEPKPENLLREIESALERTPEVDEGWRKGGGSRKDKIVQIRQEIREMENQVALLADSMIDADINATYRAVSSLFMTNFNRDACFMYGHFILDSNQIDLPELEPHLTRNQGYSTDTTQQPSHHQNPFYYLNRQKDLRSGPRVENGPLYPRRSARRYFVLPSPGNAAITEEILTAFISMFSNPNSEFSRRIQDQSHRTLPALLHDMVVLTKQRRATSLKERSLDVGQHLADPILWNESRNSHDEQDNDDSTFEDGEFVPPPLSSPHEITSLGIQMSHKDYTTVSHEEMHSSEKYGLDPLAQTQETEVLCPPMRSGVLPRRSATSPTELGTALSTPKRTPKQRKAHLRNHFRMARASHDGHAAVNIASFNVPVTKSLQQQSSSEISRAILAKQLAYQSIKVRNDQRIRTFANLEASYKTVAAYQSRFLRRNWHLGMFEQMFALNYPTEWLHQRRRSAALDSHTPAAKLAEKRRSIQNRNTSYIKNLWR